MREIESLNIARRILEQKGFKNIKFLGKPYGFEAWKDDFKYAIEVKGSNLSFTTSWSQLRQMYFNHFLPMDERI